MTAILRHLTSYAAVVFVYPALGLVFLAGCFLAVAS